jgi:FkbM family methyltransferase
MLLKALLRNSVNCLPYSVRCNLRRVPGIAAIQRLMVQKLLIGEFVHRINLGPAAGLKMTINLPDDKAMWAGIFEPRFASALAAAVPAGKVCYDIGGYKGYMSGVMALNGAASVHIFEPLPANLASISSLCALNPQLAMTLHSCAVGASNGFMQLHVMPDTSMGKLANSSFQPNAVPAESIEVKIISLDSMHACGHLPPPSLIKIDVEGAEVSVLLGATDLLRIHRPTIFLEAHSEELEIDCRSILEANSYQVDRLDPGELPKDETRHLVAKSKTSEQ